MLAALGFGSISVFTLLVMTKRISAVAGLILIPTVFGLLGGFGADLGNMMVSGVVDTAPTAVLLTFALLYFLVMTECGLFEPLIRKILSIVGEDPVRIVVGTAILIMCIGLDGDGSTAAFVVITSMYPIYRQVGINPLIIAMLLAIICPTLNWMPWGGPAARMAVSLEIDVADVVLPMLPALVLTLAAALVFAYFVGRGERRKLGARKAQAALVEEDGEASIGEPRTPIPTKNVWFNFALTIAFIVSMGIELLPLPALAMIAFSIAVTVNWPNLRTQNEKLKPHAGTVVMVISLILAAGAFSGILNDSGMVKAMSDALVTHLPEAWGGGFAFVTALISGPLLFILSNDSFYFGVVPVLAETGSAYGIPPEVIAHSVLPGIYLHTLSPLSAPIYLVASLLRTDFGTLQRFSLRWAIGITLTAIAAATITGAIYAT
ncbi:CitMHS family transporter [Nonomuraea sp. ZG12]|uniref:CitMHS family transporter n=1 Tax=Nonomuraea sp. ZG12 TaxID=3452207 RepID=UPI003F8CA574